jgi:solute carrier family 25 (mitochondrial carnitine/acylcarnitine transporter), member 20/29
VRGLYKGATPPLLGWMASDSILLGSLAIYRKMLLTNFFSNKVSTPLSNSAQAVEEQLPTLGHALAGVLSGWTVSVVACPIEQVKGRLQVQYAAAQAARFYRGPIDCARRIVQSHGVAGLYHGLSASMLFRSFFFFWWGSYDILSKKFRQNTNLSTPTINFVAGGLSAQIFWLSAYPFDVLKQRLMTDSLGGRLGDGRPRYHGLASAARSLRAEAGYRGFWRGFTPCFLRAFPANGVALVAFEAVMRSFPDEKLREEHAAL